MSLNAKQQRFVDEYLTDLNATQAAIRAGYSAKTASEQAYDLLRKPQIQELISERQQDRKQRTEITQDRVLQELARLAFLDIRRAFNDDGSLKPINELDDDTAAAIAGMDIVEMAGAAGMGPDGVDHIPLQTKKIKLAEKKGAIELLMRHMGMLNDKLEIKNVGERADRLRAARDRKGKA
jgi:phage terminase small subunit